MERIQTELSACNYANHDIKTMQSRQQSQGKIVTTKHFQHSRSNLRLTHDPISFLICFFCPLCFPSLTAADYNFPREDDQSTALALSSTQFSKHCEGLITMLNAKAKNAQRHLSNVNTRAWLQPLTNPLFTQSKIKMMFNKRDAKGHIHKPQVH